MPKKSAKSAYFYFMLEHKDRMARKGKMISLQQAAEQASAAWQRLSAEQRVPFEKLAEHEKYADRSTTGRLSSQGVPISLIKEQQESIINERNEMEKIIKDTVQNSYINNCIDTHPYFFIMGNYFCKTTSGDYFPAELAIVKFTLKDGASRNIFMYLKKNSLPLGYAFTAKQLSDSTHRLPIPPHAMGTENWVDCFRHILEFITIDGVVYPLYTLPEHMPMIKSFMRQFCQGEDCCDPNTLSIYSLTFLFFVIKNQTSKYGVNSNATAFNSVHTAQTMLDRDIYDYTAGISCTYHEDNDASKYCALSFCTRWAFTISDHVCLDLNIKFILGQHVPPNSDVKTTYNILEQADDTFSSLSKYTESVKTERTLSNYTLNPERKRYNNEDDTFTSYSDVTSAVLKHSLKTDDFPALGLQKKNNKNFKNKKGYNFDNDDGGGTSRSTFAGVAAVAAHIKTGKQVFSDDDNESISSISLNDDDDLLVPNPWASRTSKCSTREPNDSSFDFGSVVRGQGRGNLLAKCPTSGKSSYALGRGRFVQK